MFELKGKPILVFDLETDSLDANIAKLKWFGAYSYLDDEYYLLPFTEKVKILSLLQRHKIYVSFNGETFDMPILEKDFKFYYNKKTKTHVDLCRISRKRLNKGAMGIEVSEYSLRVIAETLKLSEEGKGDIDYNLLKKDSWTIPEQVQIKIYVKQDIELTKKLLEYFNYIFETCTEKLSNQDNDKLVHINASPSSLAYRVILNNAGIKYEWSDDNKKESYEGAHHIIPRKKKYIGKIYSLDFRSMYPHILMMMNLLSPKQGGYKGKDFLKLEGEYDNSSLGKIEQSLRQILLERLEARKLKNTPKNLGYKVLINSFSGAIGNASFKTVYNPRTSGDMTRSARTILRRLAATLEENGFEVLYGYTDGIYVLVPEYSSLSELMFICDLFIKDILSKVPFPMDTFGLEVDKEIKFMYFFKQLNCYMTVDKDNIIKYTSTLFDKDTPQAILTLFKEYISPKILSEMDIKFTEKELLEKLNIILEEHPESAAETHTVMATTSYKVKSSLEYQISEKYGAGKYKLMPNTASIGVGKSTRYCTIDEFNTAGLTFNNININHLVQYLKPFYTTKEDWESL